jgi:hypothetical protein
MVLSADPEMIRDLSGLKATDQTMSLCPEMVRSKLSAGAFQARDKTVPHLAGKRILRGVGVNDKNPHK